MTIKERQDRVSELTESIALQEILLNKGAQKLKDLNDLYNKTDKEYKDLLTKKGRLQDEVAALMKTANLYSNF